MKIFPGMLAAGLLASTLCACQGQALSPARLFLQPSYLVARSVSSSQLDLIWADNNNTETGFELQFATNASFMGATPFGFGPNRTRFSHTGLGPITTYWYRIKAEGSGGGVSAWSNPAFATTAPDGVEATPRVVLLGGQQRPVSSAIDVSWMPNSANTNISGYTLRYSTAAGSCKDRAVAGGNGSSTYTATGLVPSKTYSVSVRADGGAYSSAFSAPANATTSPDGLIGTRISPLFFGQNAWLPLKIGAEEKNGDLEELLCGASYALDGHLQGGPCLHAEVYDSGVKLMRYGGKGVDQYYVPDSGAADDRSSAQYLTMADNMRANGIEPLLEVPWFDGAYLDGDLAKNAAQAADLVRYINITHDRCVRYWTIGNEPNAYDSIKDLVGTDTTTAAFEKAKKIADYFKEYVTAMRNVDPTIVIVGPDLSFYDDGIMSELLAPGGPNDICGSYEDAAGKHYYLDVVDFHNYPFSGLYPGIPDPDNPGGFLDPPEEDPDQTRPNIIAYPQGPDPLDPNEDPLHGFRGKVEAMKGLVDQCNTNSVYTRTGTEMLKMAVTEINIEYRNPADLSLSGVSAQSFLAGQYWADVMNVGMKNGLEFIAFWSVKEGDPELGYIKNDYTKLPTYHHYEMLAENFRGVYAPATSVEVNGVVDPNVKAFGAKDLGQIVVMLLNQKQNPEGSDAADLDYSVRLDDAGMFTGSNALQVNIDADVAAQYDSPADGKLAAESTVMLVFNAAGVLRERHVYGRLSSGTAAPTEHNN